MNLIDIAKIANVSVSTVSKAFSGAKDINSETKANILKIAEQYGCLGKYMKPKYGKRIIAVICPEIKSQVYAVAVEKLQREIESFGGITVLGTDNFSQARRNELVDYYATYHHVDGMITFGNVDIKKGYDTPIVALGNAEYRDILISDHSALDQAVKHLKALGHRNIAYLGEDLTQSRGSHIKKALSDNQLDVNDKNFVYSHQRFEKAGYDGANTLFTSGADFSAIFCAYDYIAMGAIRYLNEYGYSIPKDISVIGVDNIELGGYLPRSLTSIGYDPDELAKKAVALLYKKIDNHWYTEKNGITVECKLYIRESTGPVK